VAEVRTRALVLRTFDHGESDRRVHLYSEALGRVSAIAKGARRSRRRFPGTLEIFALLDVQLVLPPRSALLRLDSAGLERAFEGLVADLGRYAIACQLLELLDRYTGEHEANPDLFRFAVGVLEVLDGEQPDRLLALLVLAKTLARLGYRPMLDTCALCGAALPPRGRVAFIPRDGGAACGRCVPSEEARVPTVLLAALEAGIRTPLRERAKLGLGSAAVAEGERLLERFFLFHLGSELRTSAFLRGILTFRRLDAESPAVNTAPARRAPAAPDAEPPAGGSTLEQAS
jgi:DNA repair protein RecO (recombination protein O)